jgi:hypothetical protein
MHEVMKKQRCRAFHDFHDTILDEQGKITPTAAQLNKRGNALARDEKSDGNILKNRCTPCTKRMS